MSVKSDIDTACIFCKREDGLRVNRKKKNNCHGFIMYVYCGWCESRGPKAYSEDEAVNLYGMAWQGKGK